LILTYSCMALGWVLMFAALSQPSAVAFMVAVYFYQSMVGASQIVMLECLTGICDATNSARILGVAEMVGCVFGMLGGYAGEALLTLSIGAPFVVGMAWSFFSVSFLVLSFVCRQRERDRAYEPLAVEKARDFENRIVVSMISGVSKMTLQRENSFISS